MLLTEFLTRGEEHVVQLQVGALRFFDLVEQAGQLGQVLATGPVTTLFETGTQVAFFA